MIGDIIRKSHHVEGIMDTKDSQRYLDNLLDERNSAAIYTAL